MSAIPPQAGVVSGKGTLYNPPLQLIPPPGGIRFGKFCAIAPNLKIIGTNHDYNFPSIQYTFYKTYFNQAHPVDTTSSAFSKGPVVIGNDVWIGEDVILLSGVTIGDGACIGAGSIVTRDVEPYAICAGTPCRKIKSRYSEDVIELLVNMKWWDWDDEVLRANKVFFNTNLNRHTVAEIKALLIT